MQRRCRSSTSSSANPTHRRSCWSTAFRPAASTGSKSPSSSATAIAICAMDFPGYGFSDKPLGWGYSLTRDAEVLEHYVADVLSLESMIVLAHDRGSSVAMIHATGGESRVALEHLFITNGNIFLPLSNLTQAQRLMLDSETGPALLAQMTPEQLAAGMGQTTYTPPRGADDPEIEALTAIFSHGEGAQGPARDDPVPRRTFPGRGLVAAGARRVRGSDDVHLGRLRHRRSTAGHQLRLERAHDEEAGAELAVLHPGRKPLPAERPSRRARRDVPACARGARRHAAGRDRAQARRRPCSSTARDRSCREPPTSWCTPPEPARTISPQ